MAEILVKPEPLLTLIEADLPPDPCWINPGLLPKGGLLLFGGQAATGKSFVMLELARALSTGTMPFNCPKMSVGPPCRVLMVEQELGPYGLQKRVKRIFDKEDKKAYGDNMWYVSKVPEMQLDTDRGRKILEGIIKEARPNVLLLDPIGRMNSYEENNSGQIQQLFTYLEGLIKEGRKDGLAIVISHHFGKPSSDPNNTRSPLDAYNFRGSSKWFDCPDTRITMGRLANLKTKHRAWNIRMHVVTRQDEDPDDMMFSVNRLNDLRVRYEKSYGKDSTADDTPDPPVEVPKPEPGQPMPKKQLRFIEA